MVVSHLRGALSPRPRLLLAARLAAACKVAGELVYMSPPEEVESEEHLQRFVHEHANVIASCFPVGSEGGDDSNKQQKALEELEVAAADLAAVCRVNSLSTIAAAGLLLPDAAAAATAIGGGGGHQAPCWLFIRDGKMVSLQSI